MDKEMKKLLLVAVSVGVFLLVTITVAIIVMTPKAGKQEVTFTSPNPGTQSRLQPLQNPQPNEMVSTGTPAETTIVNSKENNEVAIIDRNNGNGVTIHVPVPTTAAVPENTEPVQAAVVRQLPAAEPAAAAETSAANASASAVSVRATQETTARNTPSARASASSTTTAVTARPASNARAASSPVRTITDYWVQTGAYSARIRAEDAKEFLAAKGITSIIENRDINGQLWYRVRLGPYISENEARHWLEIVQVIDGFSGSQIRQSVRAQ